MQLSTCVFLIVSLHGSLAQTSQDLCVGCVMINGAGYNNHTDCDKFIQCLYNENNVLDGQIMSCPFATYWDMNALTCSSVAKIQCDTDRCLYQPDNSEYGAETNCRGYWTCLNGRSQPMCCPKNESYVDGIGCVFDVNDACTDTCFGIAERFHVPIVCDKKAILGQPSSYQQEIAGWGLMVRPCALGTMFAEDSCACLKFTPEFISQIVQKRTCTPEIHLPFTVDHRDESGRGNWVGNENVEIRDGVAVFNGINSRLIIPRFTNLEHSSTVVIKAKYSSTHERWNGGLARALVANSDCGNLPSILIAEDSSNQYFGVGTNEAKFAYTFVPQRDVDPVLPRPLKVAEYRFDSGLFSGSNGVDSDAVGAPGYLRNVKCAVQIGHAEHLQPFEGEIDELTIYLCDPDKL